MRTSAIAAIAGAAAEAALYARYDAAFAPAMIAHDDCAELPKLCTDGVTLNGGLTILTYLCPEKTAAPSTVTVTTTATTTVTADLPNSTSWSVASTVFDIAPTSFNEGASTSEKPTTSDEPTTTMTILSTANVTVTRVVTRVSDSPLPTAVTISGSFTAVHPSDVGGSLTTASNTSPEVLQPDPVTSVALSSVSGGINYTDIFPSHIVTTNSSSAAYSPPPVTSSSYVASSSSADSSSTGSSLSTSSSSAAYSAPLYSNSTSSTSSRFHAPTFVIGKEARDVKSTETVRSTETVTATATATATAPAATTSKGMAGESRVSFAALFLGLMVAARIV